MTRDHVPADDLRRRLDALVGDGLDGVAPTADELEAARLTAHALGELSSAEAAAVERALAEPAAGAARLDVEATRALATRLREVSRSVPSADMPRGSGALRTAVTAALAGRTTAAGPVRRARPAGSRFRALAGLAATGATAAGVLLAVGLSRDGGEGVAGRPPVPAAPRPALDEVAVAAPAPMLGFDPATSEVAAPPVAAAPAAEFGSRGGQAAPDGSADATGSGQSERIEASGRARGLAAGGAPSDGKAVVDESARKSALAVRGARVSDVAPGGPPGSAAAPSAGGVGGAGGMARLEELAAKEWEAKDSEEKVAEAVPLGDFAAGRVLREAEVELGEKSSAEGRLAARGRWFDERDRLAVAPGSERYARFVENSFRNPAEAPLSTFSIDVDTASYALVRRFLGDRQVPPPDAVRLEEMLNYFRYDDPAPDGDDPLAVRLESAGCPWEPGHRLLRVALKGRDVAAAARPGTSLVFLVDVSGSMNEPDKLPLVKQSLSMLVDQLTENDRVAIVTYAGDAGVRLEPVSGDQKARIRAAIDGLSAGGSTNGSAGIEVAYRLAQQAFVKGGSNRVLLATDGDLNVGITDDAALVGLIQEKAAGGVFLTVLGFGKGNLQDEKMEKLADNGNGVYAYLDGAREARKVLVEQLTGSTLTIAKDVKIQIEFNPARVAGYRLLGYENRLLAARDFKDDTKDAGEVGAGHGVTALYEIVPAGGSGAAAVEEPLKYRPAPATPEPVAAGGPASPELCTVKLRWKAPEASESVAREFPFVDAGGDFAAASSDLRFAAAVAEFGMLLRDSRHRGGASLAHVAATAAGALGADPGGLRAEFLDLVREAGALLPHERRGTPN